jgi:hypothetical protein
MDDAVIDATVVAFANGPIEARITGALARCLPVIMHIVNDEWRCRYNAKLLFEYEQHVKSRRNDLIEAFFSVLDSPRAVLAKNNLRRHEYAKAREIRWPTHDHHLLAAAIDGVNTSIVVTEERLARLHAPARRLFGVSVQQV